MFFLVWFSQFSNILENNYLYFIYSHQQLKERRNHGVDVNYR